MFRVLVERRHCLTVPTSRGEILPPVNTTHTRQGSFATGIKVLLAIIRLRSYSLIFIPVEGKDYYCRPCSKITDGNSVKSLEVWIFIILAPERQTEQICKKAR